MHPYWNKLCIHIGINYASIGFRFILFLSLFFRNMGSIPKYIINIHYFNSKSVSRFGSALGIRPPSAAAGEARLIYTDGAEKVFGNTLKYTYIQFV